MSDLVPFGKHKGKPLNALLDDREYLDWVLEQPWFRQKYGNIYQIVINNGQEPSETPEHNLMQAQYLNKQYAYSVIHPVLLKCAPGQSEYRLSAIDFEPEGGGDVGIIASWDKHHPLGDYVFRQATVIIELKPAMGDDYPAVLRTMKRIGANRSGSKDVFIIKLLVVRNYSGAINREQLVQIFNLSNIHVVFESDVNIDVKGGR